MPILRHLPDVVRRHGALPNFSMDPFESFDNELVGYTTGSLAVGLQVAKGSCRRLIGSSMDQFSSDPYPDSCSKKESYELRQPLPRWLCRLASFTLFLLNPMNTLACVCFNTQAKELHLLRTLGME